MEVSNLVFYAQSTNTVISGRAKWGKREIIYLSLHCHQQNDSCIKMGSDESHFNVSLIVRDKKSQDGVHKPQPF